MSRIKLFDNFARLSLYRKSVVKVNTFDEITYTGILHFNDPVKGYCTLKRVRRDCNSFHQLVNIVYLNILRVEILSESNDTDDDEDTFKSENVESLNVDCPETSSSDSIAIIESFDLHSAISGLKLPVTDDIIIVGNSDDELSTVVTIIKKNKLIGFDVFGDVSRNGDIKYFVLSVAEGTYIFTSELDSILALAPFLESSNYIKVMFGCERVSDALFHKHCITLENVFDCRIYDYYYDWRCQVNRMSQLCRQNKVPKAKVKTLRQCLLKNLAINLPELNFTDFTDLTDELCNYMQQKTVLLRELAFNLFGKFHETPNQLSEKRMNLLRDATDEEYFYINNEEAMFDVLSEKLKKDDDMESLMRKMGLSDFDENFS